MSQKTWVEERKKIEKNTGRFFEKPKFSNFEKKVFILFEFLDQIIINPFWIKLTQLEKTGLLCKNFIRWEIWKLISILQLQVDHVFRALYTFALTTVELAFP